MVEVFKPVSATLHVLWAIAPCANSRVMKREYSVSGSQPPQGLEPHKPVCP